MFGNIFTGESFGAAKITNALNMMEVPSSEMDRWFTWDEDYSLLPTIAVDHEHARLYVLESVAEGAPLPVAKKGIRGTYDITIPRFGEREALLNRSLIGVRETGGTNTIVIEGERDKRLMRIKQRILHTRGWLKAKALAGQIYDAAGRLLVDFNAKQGQGGQITIDIDLTGAGVDVNEELVLVKEVCEHVMRETDFVVTGYKLVCGRRAHRFIRANESVIEAHKDITNVAFLRQDNRDGIMLADNVNVVNFTRTQRGVGFIDEGDDPEYGVAYLVPEAAGFGQVAYGPSGLNPHLGTPNEFYGMSKPRADEDGVDLLGESYMVAWFALQRAIIKVRIKGTPRANDQIAALIAADMAREDAIDAGDDVPA
jgi:hypothetical protein